MPEIFHDLKLRFHETLGFEATAKVSFSFALQSAERLFDIEARLVTGKDTPADLYSAMISSSQLLQWHEQVRQGITDPSSDAVMYSKPTLPQIEAALEKDNLSYERIRSLVTNQYVQNPPLGARRAIEIFFELREKYADVPLFDDRG